MLTNVLEFVTNIVVLDLCLATSCLPGHLKMVHSLSKLSQADFCPTIVITFLVYEIMHVVYLVVYLYIYTYEYIYIYMKNICVHIYMIDCYPH